VAGVIDTVARDVTEFNIGDEVFGCAGGLKGSGGALAEYMLADARLIAKKPTSLSMEESAALPLVGITAWEALFVKNHLKAGQRVLVHGGVGGVGHIGVQLAHWCGANVSATVRSQEGMATAAAFGADEVINVEVENVEQYLARLTGSAGFDLVFDTVGGPNLDKSLAAAKINGAVVTTAARSTHDLSPMHAKSLTLSVVFMLIPILKNQGREAHGKILQQLARIVDEGKLRPMVDARKFTLATINEAHALLESGKARGKVVVTVSKN
jgi:NADPH2:quinone reductase